MPKRPIRNYLNDLSPKEWIKFQKSWFVHSPPPRKKNVIRHPGKFPETLVQEFIEFFTHGGQIVLDPMVGTGSALVAALRAGRHSYGIELNPAYADIARQAVEVERNSLGESVADLTAEVITGDAAHLAELVEIYQIPPIDYMITSPPYWDMLHARGAQTQEQRRSAALNWMWCILKIPAKIKEIPEGITPMSIHTLGNSSVATVPTLFDQVRKGEGEEKFHTVSKGDLIMFASVGAGMNINAIAYRYQG